MSSEIAKAERVPIALKNGMADLQDMRQALTFFEYAIKSGLLPTSFKTPEAAMVAVQMGAELGLKPFASLQHISVVNGRPALFGKAIPGVVQASGLLDDFREWFEGEGEALTACCAVRRRGVVSERVARFGVADAKRAGLWGKPGPWTAYPRDMLTYKARTRAFTPMFADVLCGIPCLEDIQEVQYERRANRAPSQGHDPLLASLKVAAAPVSQAGLNPSGSVTEAPAPPLEEPGEGEQGAVKGDCK